MPAPDRQALGAAAEDAACSTLTARGLRLLARNVRFRFGELDLVMQEGDTLVFVEVRRRKACGFGDGAASVDRRKRRRIILAARAWLQRRRGAPALPCRFDVVAVSGLDGALDVDWIRDAFSVEDA